MLKVEVHNLNEILHSIDHLTDIEKDRAVKSGLRAAGAVFIRAGRKNLKARLKPASERKDKGIPGNLMGSFTNRVKKSKPGVLAGFNGYGAHAHLVDMGTQKRKHPITKTSGVMPANRFWRDTKDANESAALLKIEEGIGRAITRIMDRRK